MEENMKYKDSAKSFAIGAIGMFVLIGIIYLTTLRSVVTDTQEVLTAYTDSMIHFQNERGEHIAFVNAIATVRVKDFLKIKSQDSTIRNLQEKVKRYEKELKKGGSVTNIGTTTSVSGTTPTVVVPPTVIPSDTNKTLVYTFPVYKFKHTDEWINLVGEASKDSTNFTIDVRNDYTVAVVRDKKGKNYAEVTTANPYTTVTTMKTYAVTMPKQRHKWFGLGLQMGYGLTDKLSPYVGAGISINFITF